MEKLTKNDLILCVLCLLLSTVPFDKMSTSDKSPPTNLSIITFLICLYKNLDYTKLNTEYKVNDSESDASAVITLNNGCFHIVVTNNNSNKRVPIAYERK